MKTSLTAVEKLKQYILFTALDQTFPCNTPEEIGAKWEIASQEDDFSDAMNEVRGGDVETDIEPDTCGYYESKSVATKMLDGTWVGWTYYFGGGKHAEPGEIEWIDYAYDLDVREETRVVQVFTKKVRP